MIANNNIHRDAEIILDIALRLYTARLAAAPKRTVQDRDRDLELLNDAISDAQDLAQALFSTPQDTSH
jgi:hypothetical protein